MTYEELLRKFVEYTKLGDKADQVAFNKVKELLGEHIADLVVAEKYAGRFQASEEVLRRGLAGPPILDRVYDLGEGRFLLASEEEMILIDAKFGTTPLSKSAFRDSYLVGNDKSLTALPQAGQVEQLEANWVKYRVQELAAAERKAAGAAGRAAESSLSERLIRAAENRKLTVLEIRTTSLDIENGVVSGANVEIVDRSQSFYEQLISARRRTDVATPLARKEAIDRLYLARSEIIAKEHATALEAASKNLRKAKKEVRGAQKELAKAAKADTQDRRRKAWEEKKAALDKADEEYKQAKKAAAKSEKVVEENERALAQSSKARKAQQAELKAAAQKSAEAERAAQAAADADKRAVNWTVSQEARGVGSTAVADRGVRAVGTDRAVTLAKAGEAERALEVAVKTEKALVTAEREAVRAARRASALRRFLLKGGRLAKAGRFVFVLFEVANLVLDLVLVTELVDVLVAWIDRERIADREEWARLAQFLSSPTEGVRMPPYGTLYIAGLGTAMSTSLQTILGGGGGDNLLAWFDKWNADPIWSGFVYATITVTLERQRVLQADDDDEYVNTYFMVGPQFQLEVTVSPRPNRRTVTKNFGNFGSGDKNNRRTGEQRETPADPSYNLGVEATQEDVIYTYPVPALTPFDYISVKCNDLLSELIVFLSQHDPQIVAGFEERSEILPGVMYSWFTQDGFAPPLDGAQIMWCLNELHRALDNFALHVPQVGDNKLKFPPKLNMGYWRRFQLLDAYAGVNKTTAPFKQIATHLKLIVKGADPQNLPEDHCYLVEMAEDIHKDIVRTFKACRNEPTNVEYSYEGKPPPPPPAHKVK